MLQANKTYIPSKSPTSGQLSTINPPKLELTKIGPQTPNEPIPLLSSIKPLQGPPPKMKTTLNFSDLLGIHLPNGPCLNSLEFRPGNGLEEAHTLGMLSETRQTNQWKTLAVRERYFGIARSTNQDYIAA